MENNQKHLFTRRGMLKSFGIAGAAIVSSPVFNAGEAIAKSAKNAVGAKKNGVTAGILIPRNNQNASYFLNGLSLYIHEREKQENAIPFYPIVEETEIGAHSSLSKFRSLIKHHDIDLAIGFMNSRITESLSADFDNAKIPFIEANLGENFFHRERASDYAFNSSLNLWQSHYILGKWASEHDGSEAICMSSFHDCAYDAHYAFEAGFNGGGGNVLKTIVTGNPSGYISPIEAASFAAQSHATVIFLNYSESDAAIFVSALRNLGDLNGKKIYASGMLSQPRAASFLGNAINGITIAHTWLGLTETSHTFFTSYREAYGHNPNDCSVLGYDTAGLIYSAINKSSLTTLKSSLEHASFDSPRGHIRMNSATHVAETAVSLFHMDYSFETGEHKVFSVQNIPSVLRNVEFTLTGDIRSGAINMYPFAA